MFDNPLAGPMIDHQATDYQGTLQLTASFIQGEQNDFTFPKDIGSISLCFSSY